MKARKDRRAGDIPVMKGIRETIYNVNEDNDYTPTQGTVRVDIRDKDIDIEDTRIKKPKVPTTSVRNQLKDARKRGDPKEEAVVNSMLDLIIPINLCTFLTYAPAIKKRFFSRF
jgi:hypothetical protein